MPNKKDLNSQTQSDTNPIINQEDDLGVDLNLVDLGVDLNDDDLLITTEETITIITEEDESLLEDEEFLLGNNKTKNKKKVDLEEDDMDFDSYFYQEE